MRRQLLSFVTAFAFSASAAFAQSGTTVTGRVTSDVGAPLGGASVFLAGTNIGATTADVEVPTTRLLNWIVPWPKLLFAIKPPKTKTVRYVVFI